MQAVQVAASKHDARLFRNNNGTGWIGKAHHTPTYLVIKNPRPLHAGLCTGSSDLIGWTPIQIKEEHVGSTLAVFTAAEIKSATGRLTTEQRSFIEAVNRAGGIAACVRSVEHFVGVLNAARGLG